MFTADINPKDKSSVSVICNGSWFCSLCSYDSSPLACALPASGILCSFPSTIGVFFPAGRQNLKEDPLCHLSSSMAKASKGRPDNYFYQPARNSSLCFLGTLCDFQRPFSHLDLSDGTQISYQQFRLPLFSVPLIVAEKMHLFSVQGYGGRGMHVSIEIRG